MGVIEAIILGIVQGLTEFLPISSTAHIRILPALLGWEDPGAGFTAVIQLGTLMAVLIYFKKDLLGILLGWCKWFLGGQHRGTPEAKMGWAILVGTVPIVILGVLFKDQIENELRSLYVIAWALIGLGALLLIAERLGKRQRKVQEATFRDGLWIGGWQAVALIPGSSRSGSTMTGGLFANFDRESAARFSFLLSVPSVFAAGIYSVVRHLSEVSGPLLGPIIIATLTAFVSGYWAIAFLMKFLQNNSLLPFVIYRFMLAVLILILLQQGVLTPMTGIVQSHGVPQ